MRERIARFRNAVTRKPTDRIPTNYYATPEFSAALCERCGTDLEDVVYNIFRCDRRRLGERNEIRYIGPEPRRYEDGSFDSIFGTRQRTVNYGAGEYTETVVHPLRDVTELRTIDAYPWPSPDWGRIRTWRKSANSIPVIR